MYSSAPRLRSSVILTEGTTKPNSLDTCLLTPVTLDTRGPVFSLSTSLIKPYPNCIDIAELSATSFNFIMSGFSSSSYGL